MKAFPEHSVVRLTKPLTVQDEDKTYHFPQGEEGTIVHISSGEPPAYLVEFMPRAPKFDENNNVLDCGEFTEGWVEHQDLILVWQLPTA